MAVLESDFSVDDTLAAGIDEPIWSPPAQDEAGRGGTVVSQSRAGQGSQAREARRSPYRDAKRLRKAQEPVEAQKDTINTLRHQIRDLRKAVKEAETQESTIRGLSGMIERLRTRLRDFQDQRDTIRVLNWQVDTLRLDLDGLRGSLKRSEDEKKALEAEMAELRATRSVLSRRLFGRKSEQQKKPGASAASNAVRPATATPRGPSLMSGAKRSIRRRRHASAHPAGSPMRRTVPRNPPLSRSRSRLTSA